MGDIQASDPCPRVEECWAREVKDSSAIAWWPRELSFLWAPLLPHPVLALVTATLLPVADPILSPGTSGYGSRGFQKVGCESSVAKEVAASCPAPLADHWVLWITEWGAVHVADCELTVCRPPQG